MNWLYYPYFFSFVATLWFVAVVLLFWQKRSKISLLLAGAGVAALLVFAFGLWQHLGRPPFRTLGETRLWYSLFLPIIGLVTVVKWRYRWFLQYSLVLALVFLTINMLKPETHERTLMPALQSPWFVPHVIVYIFAYALLAASSLVAIKGLIQQYRNNLSTETLRLADNLVYIGFSFLTLGLVFGALWAKEAWGDYWTWDPKETWALICWLGYLLYIHLRYHKADAHKVALWILALSFAVLLVCWFGINYLPTAENSVHTYSQ